MRRTAVVLLLLASPLFAQVAGVARVPLSKDLPQEPSHLIVTGDGSLWIGMKFDAVLYRFAGSAAWQRVEMPQWGFYDFTVGPDGALWVATDKYVGRVDLATGLTRPWFEHPSAHRVLTGSDGNIWFLQGVDEVDRIWHSTLVRFSPDGVALAKYRVDGVRGLVFGSDGALWMSNAEGGPHLVRMTTAGEQTKYPVEAASELFAGPGFLWTTFSDRIVRLNLEGAVIGTYRVAMTPVGVDAIGNLWLRAQTAAGEEIARLTPGGILTRFAALPALPTDECTFEVLHGGFAVLPDGRVAMSEYSLKAGGRPWDPCNFLPDVSGAQLTILDPALAPVASIEQLNPAPRRRLVRR